MLTFSYLRSHVVVIGVLAAACAADTSDSSSEQSSDLKGPTSRPGHGEICGPRYVSAANGSDAFSTGDNDCRAHSHPCKTIQHAIEAACSGAKISIEDGVYTENVVVDRPLSLVAASRSAVIKPAVSAPAPCGTNAVCNVAGSTVVLVRADNVSLRGFTIDGDNPALTSGIVRGGADLDARYGIYVDSTRAYNNLTVEEVTVQNIYSRGIEASSGGTFSFVGNTVTNIRGDVNSVAMLNYGGAGAMIFNQIFDANDAIASNHSRGIRFDYNYIERSGSGVHTDNSGDSANATADSLMGNVVNHCSAGGYGVWVFVPYVAPSVSANFVTDCDNGLAIFGSGPTSTDRTKFTDNYVESSGSASSFGVIVSTSIAPYGSRNVTADFKTNDVHGAKYGFAIEQETGLVTDVTLECNRINKNKTGVYSEVATAVLRNNAITNNSVAGLDATTVSSGKVDAENNFWNCVSGPGNSGCDVVTGSADFSSPLSQVAACTAW